MATTDKRRKVTVTYLDGFDEPEVHFIEELAELDPLIEHGPDWRAIQSITIHRNHASAAEAA
jgi:hypothetical protein